jgi:hypothetical protein
MPVQPGIIGTGELGLFIKNGKYSRDQEACTPGICFTHSQAADNHGLSITGMYAHTLIAGTSLWVGGTLLVLAHILIPSVDSHYNSPLVSTLATVGVVAWGAGAVVLPIGGWEKHRYNKSLRIELAKRGM